MKDQFTIRHGLIAVEQESTRLVVRHFVGYPEKPTQGDKDSLRQELSTSSEFGLIGKMDKIAIVDAPQELVEFMRQKIQ